MIEITNKMANPFWCANLILKINELASSIFAPENDNANNVNEAIVKSFRLDFKPSSVSIAVSNSSLVFII